VGPVVLRIGGGKKGGKERGKASGDGGMTSPATRRQPDRGTALVVAVGVPREWLRVPNSGPVAPVEQGTPPARAPGAALSREEGAKRRGHHPVVKPVG
jgi:hypothetical protein